MKANVLELDQHAVKSAKSNQSASQPSDNSVQFPSPSPSSSPKRPRSEAQIAASRENGKKGRGPISPEGKRNSSRNSTKHGCSATRCAYSNQNFPGIERIANKLRIEFKPQTPAESALVDTIALARWQQLSIPEKIAALINHIRDTQIKTSSFTEALANAKAQEKLHQEGTTLSNFHRYLVAAEHRLSHAMRDLDLLRSHSHSLHETESAAAHLDYESVPVAETTLPDTDADQQATPPSPEQAGFQIEPDCPLNKPETNADKPQYEATYPTTASPAAKNTAISDSTKPFDPYDPMPANLSGSNI